MKPPALNARRVAALAAVTLTSALIVAHPVSADSSLVGLAVTYRGQQAIYVDACLTTVENLPAQVVLAYTISTGSSVVASDSWDGGSPGTIFIDAPTCPASFAQFVSTDLVPGTTYTVQVTATVTAMVEDDNFELAPDPVGYPAFSSTTSVDITTLPASPVVPDASAGGGGATPGGSGGGGGGSGGSSTGGSGGSTGAGGAAAGGGAASPGPGPSGSGPSGGAPLPPIVIRDPESFKPSQLVALSPQQLATIAPTTFGLLPPAAFAAMTAGQAAAVTPEQASAIRPARAAELTPRAVAALDTSTLVAIRPTAISRLSSAAVSAMTSAQLRALTPRQVAALRPAQVAGLTAAEKALLRR